MKELYNRLLQLQELYFAFDEHRLSGHENQLEQLEKSIRHLLRQLPAPTASLFRQLQEREPPALAPVVDATCYGCGIGLPTSLSAELLHMDELRQCPNCNRFLYPYEGEKLSREDGSLSRRLPRLGIERFSSKKLMLVNLNSQDKEGTIAELAHLISEELYFKNPQILIEKALAREAIMSTAFAHSLAFPHVRGVEAGSLTLALGLKHKGIKFGAPRNQLTRIIFFTVIPSSSSAFYLTLLVGLLQSFQKAEARKTLLSSSSQEELWEKLKKITEKHIP